MANPEQKARYLAMRRALAVIEAQPDGLCRGCADWHTRHRRETQQLQQEIGDLREALKRLLGQLGRFLPGQEVSQLLQELNLDRRLLGSIAEKPSPSEHDLAVMKLAAVGKELAQTRAENMELVKQQAQSDRELSEQRRRNEALVKELQKERSRFHEACPEFPQEPRRGKPQRTKDLSLFPRPWSKEESRQHTSRSPAVVNMKLNQLNTSCSLGRLSLP
mmetsp:Transcript_41036/g.76319  ORF Transcript_41036/g.76319 Transcript_41036/m.76319 type:complete len:219 (+) Transcript_41036:39-695(+)